MSPFEKLFTLEEANALLPAVEGHFIKMIEKKEKYAQRHDTIFMHEIIAAAEQNGGIHEHDHDQLDDEFRDLEGALEDIHADIVEINRLGCFVRDVEKGYVDFPAKIGAETVYLSWKRGEKDIQFYRGVDAKLMERQPLESKLNAG